ncbi:MAG: response regulator transcription factor [Actinomycetales bacterium]|jgi:DNA-binding response OmpR family regulator|nr:response regulator transcription factor [Actinomycetales bacterium]
MHVLVVEDDPAISAPLVAGLQRNGIDATCVHLAAMVLDSLPGKDLVILDLGLPDDDGLSVLRAIRKLSDIPVIVATARGDEMDRIIGLEIGADDYVVKPFSVRELAARVRAIARRRVVEAPLEGNSISLSRNKREVTLAGEVVELTMKEFELLAVLMEEPGRTVPRQELYSRVWDPVWIGSGKTLDVHIAGIRKKLGDPTYIETVRGVGYRFVDAT